MWIIVLLGLISAVIVYVLCANNSGISRLEEQKELEYLVEEYRAKKL